MKPLRLRDTALAALDGVCSRLRCCTPLPLCDTLFQRLRVVRYLPCPKCFWQSLLAPFSTASRRVTIIAFFPKERCTRIIRLRLQWICRIDAHSLRSLAPFVGWLCRQSVSATLRDGRRFGTRECRKSLRNRCLCCDTLFQRLALLSDTSLCPNLIWEILRLLAPLFRCGQSSLLWLI